jgi:hypothetical protein
MSPCVNAVRIACLLGPLLPAGTAQAQIATVNHASVQIVTGDRGKDEATPLTITVANASGRIFERVWRTRQVIKPYSTFNLWLQRTRAETAEKLQGSRITFRLDPKGDDHWDVKEARLTVTGEHGTRLTWHWGPFALDAQRGKPVAVEFALTDDHRQ